VTKNSRSGRGCSSVGRAPALQAVISPEDRFGSLGLPVYVVNMSLQRWALIPSSTLGAVAQVVERLLCKQQVRGSSPRSSTRGTHVCEVRLPQKRDEVGRFEGKSRSECGEELSEGVGRSASLTSSSLT
jgi:hypothetical protein